MRYSCFPCLRSQADWRCSTESRGQVSSHHSHTVDTPVVNNKIWPVWFNKQWYWPEGSHWHVVQASLHNYSKTDDEPVNSLGISVAKHFKTRLWKNVKRPWVNAAGQPPNTRAVVGWALPHKTHFALHWMCQRCKFTAAGRVSETAWRIKENWPVLHPSNNLFPVPQLDSNDIESFNLHCTESISRCLY